jgi:hypothetical protein
LVPDEIPVMILVGTLDLNFSSYFYLKT